MITKSAPYILLLGMIGIIIDGLWILTTYNDTEIYQKEAYIYLFVGLGLMFIGFLLIKRQSIRNSDIQQSPSHQKDNRFYIQQIWEKKDKIINTLVYLGLILIIILIIVDYHLIFFLSQVGFALGITVAFFIFIMREEDEEVAENEDDLKLKNKKLKKIFGWFDYRRHPFSIPLFLFLIIILSLLISKELGIAFELYETGGGRRSFPFFGAVYSLAGIVAPSGFLFIIQHCDFFGIRQRKQSYDKVIAIRFSEVFAGLVAFIWIITIIQAV